MVGKEYAKKGNYRAAAGRYLDATKWDDSNSEAWLLLGEADEKLKDKNAARRRLQEVPGSGCGRQERRRNPQETRQAAIARPEFTHLTAPTPGRRPPNSAPVRATPPRPCSLRCFPRVSDWPRWLRNSLIPCGAGRLAAYTRSAANLNFRNSCQW